MNTKQKEQSWETEFDKKYFESGFSAFMNNRLQVPPGIKDLIKAELKSKVKNYVKKLNQLVEDERGK